MTNSTQLGVFFCKNAGKNETSPEFSVLADHVRKNRDVVVVMEIEEESNLDRNFFEQLIKVNKLQKLILAGNSPGFYKSFFTNLMQKFGNKPESVVLASFNAYGASSKEFTDRAKAILSCAMYGTHFELASVPEQVEVVKNTLVIGGGIAGIQAALEIANSGLKVYLVEKTGTIGGHMAMFDKTFPTLDCAACILTPKMVEVGQHSNIEILTLSEVKEISGGAGNFKVSVLKRARKVNISTCIGCGICTEKCPTKVPSEFDAGISQRKAIYIPFPQAVPNKYLVDEKNCTYCTKGKCGICVKACPVEAINLDEKDSMVELNVGNIIVATGFKPFEPERTEKYGYGKYPNVLTSLEFERVVNSSGPTGGVLRKKSKDKKGNWIFSADGEEPNSIAIIHCIGSRDEHYHKYCSRVCCMYSLKFAHLVKEKIHHADVCQYFIDMRAFGKGYEEFYDRIKSEKINLIRGRTAKIEEKNDRLILRTEDIINDRIEEKPFDMVILAIGMEPREEAKELAHLLEIPIGQDGWFREKNVNIRSFETFTGGIYLAGACQGPKDIPDTVTQASSAASCVIRSVLNNKIGKGIKDMPSNKIEFRAKELAN